MLCAIAGAGVFQRQRFRKQRPQGCHIRQQSARHFRLEASRVRLASMGNLTKAGSSQSALSPSNLTAVRRAFENRQHARGGCLKLCLESLWSFEGCAVKTREDVRHRPLQRQMRLLISAMLGLFRSPIAMHPWSFGAAAAKQAIAPQSHRAQL